MKKFENKIIVEDCLTGLKTIPDECVDCCVTSPPYWGLRDYDTAKWIGGNEKCSHTYKAGGTGETSKIQISNKGTQSYQYKNVCKKCGAIRIDKQLGQETNFKDFISNLIDVFSEVKRVLKPTGTCFVNLGDTYNGSNAGNKDKHIQNKTLLMTPERFAIGMIDSGWILRNQIVWHKPNQMPQSAKDRFTMDFEKIFFFTKNPKGYYFEQQMEKSILINDKPRPFGKKGNKDRNDTGRMYVPGKKMMKNLEDKGQANHSMHKRRAQGLPDKNYPVRNKRSVWSINTKPFSDGGRKLGRNYVGFELNPEYKEMAEKRLYEELGMWK